MTNCVLHTLKTVATLTHYHILWLTTTVNAVDSDFDCVLFAIEVCQLIACRL